MGWGLVVYSGLHVDDHPPWSKNARTRSTALDGDSRARNARVAWATPCLLTAFFDFAS